MWTFAFADARLEKRLWMQQGANTTYVQYTLVRGSQPLTLHLQALVTYRDHHGNVASEGRFPMQVEPIANGLRLTAFDQAPPFYLLSEEFAAEPLHPPVWIDGFFLGVEAYRGQKDIEMLPARRRLRGHRASRPIGDSRRQHRPRSGSERNFGPSRTPVIRTGLARTRPRLLARPTEPKQCTNDLNQDQAGPDGL